MEAIKIEVNGNIARVTERPDKITSGTVGLPVEFTFDSQWESLRKIAVFQAGDIQKDMVVVDGATVVPIENMETPNVRLHIGVYGVNEDGSIAIPTIWANAGQIYSGAVPDGDLGSDIGTAKEQYAAAVLAAEKAESSADRAEKAATDAEEFANRASNAEEAAVRAENAEVSAQDSAARAEESADRAEQIVSNCKPKDLIVEVTLDTVVNDRTKTGYADVTANEIYEHAANGGTVVLYVGYDRYEHKVRNSGSERAFFERHEATAEGIKTSRVIISHGDMATQTSGMIDLSADAVTYTPQTLTNEQKAQAMENIGIDDVLKPLEIIDNAFGESITLKDSSAYELQGLILYGKTTQNGTPTPDAPVELESVGDGGSVSVNVIGENHEQQTVTISTPDGLRGIPLVGYDVHLYSGNHTDANGQQWVCDEIDFVRGIHVQRISDAINPVFGYVNRNNPEHDWVSVYTEYSDRMPYSRLISASLQSKSFDEVEPNASLGLDAVLWYATSSWGIAIRRSVLGIDANMGESEIVSLINAWVAEKGITVHYCLATPVETALTDHTKLHTYKPNTTITNDGGAEMAVEYVADTKTYIDNKFAELATAIVNNT